MGNIRYIQFPSTMLIIVGIFVKVKQKKALFQYSFRV